MEQNIGIQAATATVRAPTRAIAVQEGLSAAGAPAGVQAGAPVGEDASKITITSMEQFQLEQPKLYQAMVEAMLERVCSSSERANRRLIEEIKKQNREGG